MELLQVHGTVLRITENKKTLRKIISKVPNYENPKTIDWGQKVKKASWKVRTISLKESYSLIKRYL